MTADVLIAGGGIGGAVLAELLGREGRRVVVLEKSTSRPPWTRPKILWPTTVERLFSLRPRADWEQESMRPLRGVEFFNGERFVTAISDKNFEGAGVQPWSTNPNVTRELLLESRSFELHRGVEVTEVLKENGHVAGVRAQKVGGTETFEVRAKWTIGDDGRESVVRRACGLELPTQSIPVEAFCFHFDWPQQFPAGCACVMPNRQDSRCGILACGGLPLPNGKGAGLIAAFSEEFNAHPPEEAWAEARAIHPLIELMASGRKFPEDFGHIRGFRWGHVPRYGVPGALLMGDAAHPVSPAGGQGANMSVADAGVLAELLSNNTVDLPEQYERRRRPANTRSMRPTRALSFVLNLPRWCRPGLSLVRWVAPLANREAIRRSALRFVSTAFQEGESA